jgi:quinol monooxygenase YgiN
MYARSSTIHAHPSFIDEGITHVRDVVMPTLADMQGCAGMSMLIDRDGGRCIITSSWRDEDTLRASEEPAERLRDHATGVFHATAEVSRWEIAVLRRDHRSRRRAAVRATWLRTEPAGVDRLVDTYKVALVPKVEDLDGFCSASLMVDRASGRAVSSVSFDDWTAMLASRGAEQAIWAEVVNDTGGQVSEVCEFDLAIAHLNAPEMA